jgi:hypothetical protein
VGAGQESDEDKQARDDRITSAVSKYKRNNPTAVEVDNEVAVEAEAEFCNGARLMEAGKTSQAVPCFTTVIESMPPKCGHAPTA